MTIRHALPFDFRLQSLASFEDRERQVPTRAMGDLQDIRESLQALVHGNAPDANAGVDATPALVPTPVQAEVGPLQSHDADLELPLLLTGLPGIDPTPF